MGCGTFSSVIHAAETLAVAAHVLLPVNGHLGKYVVIFELLVTCGARPGPLRGRQTVRSV